MFQAIGNYFRNLVEQFGRGWNRFWYWPSDPHPLAALRIGVGLFVFYWLLTFTPDLQQYFGPNGMLKVDEIRSLRTAPTVSGTYIRGISLLDYVSDDPYLLWGAHAVALAAALAFTAGLFANISGAITLVMLLSYIWRGQVLTTPVEDVSAMLLFYTAISPCGAVLSLDHWRRMNKAKAAGTLAMENAKGFETSWATVTMRLLQIHICAMYVMMAFAKLRSSVWWNGEAVWWMLATPDSRLVDLTWMAQYPKLYNFWTHAIVGFELTYPLLIWNRLLRPLVVTLSIIMWTGTAILTGFLGLSVLMVLANFPFITAGSWKACFGMCCGKFCGAAVEGNSAGSHGTPERPVELTPSR